jgi:tetratricopeptide (TPR) repeat protein
MLAGLPAVGFSQQAQLTAAKENLESYNQQKSEASITKAKEAIDLASEHMDTKGQPSTWLYRGRIYLALYERDLHEGILREDASDLNSGYQSTPATKLNIAEESFRKVLEIETSKKTYSGFAKRYLRECADHYKKTGKYSKLAGQSIIGYENAYSVYGVLGETDTLSLFQLALHAETSKSYDKMKVYYREIINIKKSDDAYNSLAYAHLATGDTSSAREVIKTGRAAFPGSEKLLLSEVNFYFYKNQKDAAINILKDAIQKNPGNSAMHLILGNIYDQMANPKDAEGKPAPKPGNYEQLIADAEIYYKKAVDLDQQNKDALYSLGALYFNRGVSIDKAAESLKETAGYDTERKRAGEQYSKALLYFEKIDSLFLPDRPTMSALKKIYTRLNQPEKAKEMSDRLSAGKK